MENKFKLSKKILLISVIVIVVTFIITAIFSSLYIYWFGEYIGKYVIILATLSAVCSLISCYYFSAKGKIKRQNFYALLFYLYKLQ